MARLFLHSIGLVFTVVACGIAAPQVDFSRQVRPILSNACFECHGPDAEQREADLRLDREDSLRTMLDAEAPSESELLLRISSDDPDHRMPPPGSLRELTDDQKEILRSWVEQGAKWDSHWAWKPIRHPDLPESASAHPIDRFVDRQLLNKRLSASPLAANEVQLRRLFLDLLGLLPTPAETAEYLADNHPASYERLVDRLLASPHFGERWGRHWLDQARYADSDGYAIDGPRIMWPYRDWVINAINTDQPFDQFTRDQLAGDLLPEPSLEQLIATGFHRNTLVNQEGGSDREQFRNEAVVDRVNTTATVWLGLTLGCAQCHTHKYDPIDHREYYEMFAFFNSDKDANSHDPRVRVTPRDEEAQYRKLRVAVAAINHELERVKATGSKEALTALNAQQEAAKKSLAEFEKQLPQAMVMRENDKVRPTHVHVRGDFLRRGEQVHPNTLGILPGRHEVSTSDSETESSDTRDRLALANWITDPSNPLTARVVVNRIWMQYFGRGLVETENDFGTQGTPPSHPELLDWLASELVRRDWSIKAIHRLIVTSNAYRRDSSYRSDLAEVDANNIWLARQSRIRVSAEIVRDLSLVSGGLLATRVGGKSVYPPQPDGVYAFTQVKKKWPTSHGAERYRRGMYTFFFRSAAHPMLTTFDAPNFQTTCTRRLRSNTPLQALTQANDIAIVEAARGLAERLRNFPGEAEDRIAHGFMICLTRKPTAEESQRILAFYEGQRDYFADHTEEAQLLAHNKSDTAVDRAAWTAVARVMLNLDEFITRN